MDQYCDIFILFFYFLSSNIDHGTYNDNCFKSYASLLSDIIGQVMHILLALIGAHVGI